VNGTTITRADEVVAFDWQNAACDPRLPAGDFSAEWRGRLWARGAGSYTLACYVQGEVTIKLAGNTVISGRAEQPRWMTSEPVGLEFDYHPLEISFRRTQAKGQLALFWSGPDFRLEPVPERSLVHEQEKSPSIDFERGRQLAAALRCAACHVDKAGSITPAPALDRLSGNVQDGWLVEWLGLHAGVDGNKSLRRMPDVAMTKQEAEAVAAWLLREPAKTEQKKEQKESKATKATKEEAKKADSKSGKKAKGEEKPKPSAEEGERLVLSRGCLACHKFGEFGDSGLFGGGDLTRLFEKRPVDFLNRWLQDPAAINKSHRMPVFTFTGDELTSLSLWAKEKAKSGEAAAAKKRNSNDLVREGEKLVGTFKCAACHSLASDQTQQVATSQKELTEASDWGRSCGAEPRREKSQPGYRLAAEDQAVLRAYYSASRPGEGKLSPQARGRDLLVQLNCLACHQREGVDRTVAGTLRVPLPANDGTRRVPTTYLAPLQDKLVAVSEAHGELAPLVPAMTPPALNSVGDKLLDAALTDAVTRKGPAHRPYLMVQMPKFNLTTGQLDSLTAYFVATDRIPADNTPRRPFQIGEAPRPPVDAALAAAGPRLVTTDGLACTSCHQVGSVLPSKAPLNARGPDMSMLGKRIRPEWFDRWCDNPARIVPRMEMPAVKVPVRGVLNDKIDDQLAAVWHILNTPGFEPPEPNPVRVLRLSGIPEKNERPIVIHDVVKDGDKTYQYPLVIGLPNRHNILFDLESNRLAAWWLGDTARQRTKGKSWYWEMGGKSILNPVEADSEISVVVNGKRSNLIRDPQRRCGITVNDKEMSFGCSFKYESDQPENEMNDNKIVFNQHFLAASSYDGYSDERKLADSINGFCRAISFSGTNNVSEIQIRLLSPEVAKRATWDEKDRTLNLHDPSGTLLVVSRFESNRYIRNTNIRWNGDGTISLKVIRNGDIPSMWRAGVALWYSTALPADVYVPDQLKLPAISATELQIAPGFAGIRLPLAGDIMPSGFAWDDGTRIYFCTLKGQVYRVKDLDGDGVDETMDCLADGLPTPYGLDVDSKRRPLVATKAAVIRLFEESEGKKVIRQPVASGWGHTDDYHDWAVGPVRGENGEYFIALPCQQDQRSEAAAQYRGKLLKLTPQENTSLESLYTFDIEVISSGHRFPMGMARNRDGELFVTDNQGNYNPFNELNHVRKGAHYGFINALEKEKGYKPPPLTPPVINIPHPWTRSVNGICFLDTPKELGRAGSARQDSNRKDTAGTARPKSIYGPLEGHLVGCEYDTRRLIRMSLQKIGDTYQGAAYPLSIPAADVEKGLLGPIVCAIKPTTGELYVGEIRDSGWGAGNNIGQIVKIKIEPEKLPCGIAEVRATTTGFTIDFFRSVDRAKAADVTSYSVQSYRRESTPAYGGPDLDRRTETISSAEVSADGKRVTLTLPELRTGHVYELRTKNLAPGGEMFHPDEAHYTLNSIPNDQ
jgi:mono/diheme cytochrome c family protein